MIRTSSISLPSLVSIACRALVLEEFCLFVTLATPPQQLAV